MVGSRKPNGSCGRTRAAPSWREGVVCGARAAGAAALDPALSGCAPLGAGASSAAEDGAAPEAAWTGTVCTCQVSAVATTSVTVRMNGRAIDCPPQFDVTD